MPWKVENRENIFHFTHSKWLILEICCSLENNFHCMKMKLRITKILIIILKMSLMVWKQLEHVALILKRKKPHWYYIIIVYDCTSSSQKRNLHYVKIKFDNFLCLRNFHYRIKHYSSPVLFPRMLPKHAMIGNQCQNFQYWIICFKRIVYDQIRQKLIFYIYMK